ncbi:MAG: sugar phosphate isomerase/epimerase [Pirellulaceae bacterium]|jgi:sugar phosphate isomerase/epimerase|nr:xylose isomerase [Planctomycetaceae bacterium]MDP6469176.1 sugar phosphate isomerase/epimerase [Pirellulaceae bacterium]MDP6554647.1 sugar phosphate isomerase/epimerase [Pirellulaceae bacterium]MDP6719958.1 sugar phosphate isomerase/epimerase [Pirellulaceae bacterium]
MKPALSQVCSLNSPFEKDIADYAAGQCDAIEVWFTKLETYLETNSLDDARGLLAEHHVTLPVASFQGGLFTSQGDARREAWSLFQRRLELCRDLEIKTIVVACDLFGPLNDQDIERALVSLDQAAQLAAKHGKRIALEFQSRAALGNNLLTAAGLVARVDHPSLGLCLDAFHFYVGPSQTEDLACLTRENLFHVQLSDLADTPRELATDADRILPGDGDIPLEAIVARLAEIQYNGFVSVELLNPRLWQVSSRQFGEIGMTALRSVLGLASMEAP